MAYHGDIALGQTIDFQFNTFRFSTGAPFTLAGTPTLAAYVGNSVTQITAGLTLTVDFDAKTGAHNVRCVATAGNGYAAATDVTVVLEAGTVDSVSVANAVVGSFSIENRSALRPTVAARTLDVTATGAAGIDWANVENPTTVLNLSATNIDVDQVVASVSGAVGSVTGLTAANLDTTISSRASPAQVNTEVVDALNVDTYAEPGQGAPAATTTLAAKINYLYKAWRNKKTQTSTTFSLFADDATTVDQKATVSDDATTATIGEIATGP